MPCAARTFLWLSLKPATGSASSIYYLTIYYLLFIYDLGYLQFLCCWLLLLVFAADFLTQIDADAHFVRWMKQNGRRCSLPQINTEFATD